MYNVAGKIDRNIKQVKTLHSIGQISTKKAMEEIRRLEDELNDVLKLMNDNDRDSFLNNRELRKQSLQI